MRFRSTAVLVLGLFPASATSAQLPATPGCGDAPGVGLIVFVGRRVEVRPAGAAVPPLQHFLLDQRFQATYDVLEVLCGGYTAPRIAFDVYDHYGTPAFAAFETVLLYVSRQEGRLVHEKYLYDPVYQTADGGWAGCGDPYALETWAPSEVVHAVPTQFKDDVSFSIRGLTDEEISQRYPPQYFARHGDRVTCVAGARVADLFTVKRLGPLTARGVFR